MKYWALLGCLFFVGCGTSDNANIVDSSDDAAMAEYEAAIAEADKMAGEDDEME